MAQSKIVPIQFQKVMIKTIEEYIDIGLYSSKAEFVREAVRNRIIELRKTSFLDKIKDMKKLSKSRGANIKSSFISKKEKYNIAKEL